MWCNIGRNAKEVVDDVSMPHAAFYVVQLLAMTGEDEEFGFQCRTRLSMWCNLDTIEGTKVRRLVSMPHAAFYVVQHACYQLLGAWQIPFQCRTRLSMWCNLGRSGYPASQGRGFNAARGFLCGATVVSELIMGYMIVSMPHAAFYVVERLRNRQR